MRTFEQIQFRLYILFGLIFTFIIFMLYHIKHYLWIPLSQYTLVEYSLVGLAVCFLILCFVQAKRLFQAYTTLTTPEFLEVNPTDELLTNLKCLNTPELTQLVVNLFRTYGFQQEFRDIASHEQFSEILLTYQNRKILLCCKPYGNGRPISQSYLDRLYLKQLKHTADEAYFISLSDFSEECTPFATYHNLVLFNSKDMALLLQPVLT